MASLFTMFPSGRAGIALLILRTSTAALPLIGDGRLSDGVLPWVVAAVLIPDVLTPVAAAVCRLVTMAGLPSSGAVALGMITTANAAVVLLLGPGAYSVDAKLFGRRVIVLPGGRRRDGQ